MKIEDLWEDINEWQVETFGDGNTIRGTFAHLLEEMQEIIESPDSADEWADAFILLIGACRKQGFAFNEIVIAIHNKMKINKTRKWGQADKHGVIRRIKDKP